MFAPQIPCATGTRTGQSTGYAIELGIGSPIAGMTALDIAQPIDAWIEAIEVTTREQT